MQVGGVQVEVEGQKQRSRPGRSSLMRKLCTKVLLVQDQAFGCSKKVYIFQMLWSLLATKRKADTRSVLRVSAQGKVQTRPVDFRAQKGVQRRGALPPGKSEVSRQSQGLKHQKKRQNEKSGHWRILLDLHLNAPQPAGLP